MIDVSATHSEPSASPDQPARNRARRSLRAPPIQRALAHGDGLVSGWSAGWVVHRARVQREAVSAIECAGGKVEYDEVFTNEGLRDNPKPFWPRWIVERLGREYFETVTSVTAVREVGDAEMAQIGRLEHLLQLNLCTDRVTDAGLVHLRGLEGLKCLMLQTANISGAALANVEGLSELEFLYLMGMPVADSDLAHIAGLTHLKKLWLRGPQLTDAGLVHLAGLHDLRALHMEKMPVTNEGLSHLRGMVRLESLAIHGSRVTSLEPLRHLTTLTSLSLCQSPVTDEGLAPVEGFRTLLGLWLNGTSVGDSGLCAHSRLVAAGRAERSGYTGGRCRPRPYRGAVSDP